MKDILHTDDSLSTWEPSATSSRYTEALESGQVLYFPHLAFPLNGKETKLLTPNIVAANRKNVSYDLSRDRLRGFAEIDSNLKTTLHHIMHRYAATSESFLKALCPHYAKHLTTGRTSFRPVEISGRKAPSYRKDDTRLHVDAFPTTPMRDKRIIRLFTNVNPDGKPRLWRAGEPFKNVAARFAPNLKKPIPGLSKLKKWLGIIRADSSRYDHYMLGIHHAMKKDDKYQSEVDQQTLHFAAGSTWLTFTDQVSHAVDSGQYVFEQTFYLPYTQQLQPETAPQAILAQHFKGLL